MQAVSMLCWPVIFVLQLQLNAIHSTLNENLVCEDFYDYACAGWMRGRSKPDSEPFWSVYTDTAQRISSNLRAILENDSFTNVDDERQLYTACVSRSADFTNELQFLVNKLGGVQQPAQKPKTTRYDFLMHIIEVTKLLNIHPIFKLHVTHNMLHIERGQLVFPEMFLTHPERYASELNVYSKWIENSLSLLYLDSNETTLRARKQLKTFALIAKEIVAFEVKLSRLPRGKTVQIHINQLDKHMAVRFLLGDALHHVRDVFLDEKYFDALTKMAQSMHWRHVSNYILWAVIKELSRNVNAEFRRFSFEVDRQLIGVTADISRERECIDETLKYIGPRNLQHNFQLINTQPPEDLIHQVKSMANEIRNVFLSWVQGNKLFSNFGKAHILKTIASVKLHISNPDSMQQETYKPEWNYFQNLVQLKASKFEYELQKLTRTGDNETTIQWPGSIFEVNAFYSPTENAIVLPLGILQPPFFDIAQSSAPLNYGALGSLIGHEFSHVLDNLDRNALTQSDVQVLIARRNCSAFLFAAKRDVAAANENLADLTGIRLSYFAFLTRFSNDLRKENEEELFFLSYAKMWCELSGDGTQEIWAHDEHAPVAMRVKATLKSFLHFSRVFNCYVLPSENSCN